jgi:hypothetical protein
MSDLINIIPSASKEKPIFTWAGIPDTFRTKREEDAWWDRERTRWIDGHSGMTGMHYFTVTQGTYKNASNKYIRPTVRDGDLFIFEEYAGCKATSEDLFITKRRGFALSSIFGAAVPMYNSLLNPGSTNLITSADKPRLEELFKDKALVFYSELNQEIKPATVSSRQYGYLHFGTKAKNGTISGLNSKILFIQTTESPKDATAFEAYRASSAFIDEVFLHPRPDDVVASTQASMQEGFRKVNPIVLGGSCGVASTAGATKMQEYWLDAENNMVRTVFIPGWMCITEAPELDDHGNPTGRILNFCPGGRSNEKAATEWILTMRSKFEKAKNKKKLLQFIKAYPLTIDEVFDINVQGVFTEDVMDKINEASMRVTKEQYPVNRFDLVEDTAGTIRPVLNNTSGKYYIFEHPIKSRLYGAGNDPIPFGHTEDITHRRSENATSIGDPQTMRMLAYTSERTHDVDAAAMSSIMLLKYYNDAKILVERNRGGMLIDRIKTLGYGHLLAKQPRFLSGGTFDKKKPPGWYKDSHSAPLAHAELISYITKHHEEIYIKRLADELKRYIVENTDLADSWVSFLLLARDIKDEIERKSNMNLIARQTTHVVYKNGQRLVERKTVYVNESGDPGSDQNLNRPDVFRHGR